MTRVFTDSQPHQPKEVQQMETAKVDIRKLQLLNDRINQCIDALNQVRLSVHGLSQGLSHTGAQGGINAGAQYGTGPTGFGASPFGFGQPGFAQMPVGQNPLNPWTRGFAPGLSHSTGFSPYAQGVNPFLS